MKPLRRYRRLAAFAGSVLLTLLLTELGLRVIFALPALEPMARHLCGYLGNANVNDTKQRLLLRLHRKARVRMGIPPQFHPHLGLTATARTPDNPFGILTEVRYLDDQREKILFFGDSFVEGNTEAAYKIPQLLDEKLADHLVLNLGVRGYGLDQMYLYLQWASAELQPKHVLIGLLYADLNRLLFRVNQGPKPYFEVEGEDLVLRGVPIPADYEKWLELYPPRVTSYLLSAGRGLVRRGLATRWATRHLYGLHPTQTSARREEKKLLTRQLTEKIRQECRAYGIGLTFVLFPQTHHLIHEGWEELFMRGLLDELGIDYVDMEEPMTAYAADHGLIWWRDVYPLQAHPNREENQVMADFIHQHLRRQLAASAEKE